MPSPRMLTANVEYISSYEYSSYTQAPCGLELLELLPTRRTIHQGRKPEETFPEVPSRIAIS